MKIDSFIHTALIVAIAFIPKIVMAQDLVMPMASQATPAPKLSEAQIQSMPPDNEEVTILRDNYAGKYNVSTLENLSKLYWRLGAFDMEDNVAIANYIKINDCKIYSEYLNDDMEWTKIVSAMKDHLKASKESFPLDFQFVLQLHLGRYDPARGGFPIVDNTGFIDSKRIQVDSIDYNKEVCFDESVISDYPKSAVILLPEQFTLDFLTLDEHVAQAYILRKKSEYLKIPESNRQAQHERDAFLRLRVTFTQYHGNLRGESNEAMAILYGNIDGYEIFEDAAQKRMMLSIDNTKISKAPQMSTPSQRGQ